MLLHLSDDPPMHFFAGVALDVLGVLLIEDHYRFNILYKCNDGRGQYHEWDGRERDQCFMSILRMELILEG